MFLTILVFISKNIATAPTVFNIISSTSNCPVNVINCIISTINTVTAIKLVNFIKLFIFSPNKTGLKNPVGAKAI